MEPISGEYPLHTAASDGNLDLVRALLDLGFDIDECQCIDFYEIAFGTPLHKAVEQKHLAITKLLIDRGADVNSDARDCYKEQRMTPLDLALRIGQLTMIRLLRSHGAKTYIELEPERQESYRRELEGFEDFDLEADEDDED
jgi:ankyrin repeat protein